jgi:hypothetical protein
MSNTVLPGLAAIGATPLDASTSMLTGTYSDQAVDTDGDSLFNELQLTVGVNIVATSYYQVVAWLDVGNATTIYASSASTLDPGLRSVVLAFKGPDLFMAGKDGPWSVSHVELRMGYDVIDQSDNVYATSAYTRSQFDPPNARFNGFFAEATSPTTKPYDTLQINVGLSVHVPGTYTILGAFYGTADIATVSISATLGQGDQTVTLSVDGRAIFYTRENGPYYLRNLSVRDATSTYDVLTDAYTTNAYSFMDFQHSSTYILAETLQDHGLDVDADGQFEFLRVEFDVTAAQAMTCNVGVTLRNNSNGATIAYGNNTSAINVVAGQNSHVSIDIPSGPIRESNVDGPYRVQPAISCTGGSYYDTFYGISQPYQVSAFAPPLIKLTGTCADSGDDTDGDGSYDYLEIDVGIMPGKDGIVIADARIVDANGNQIGSWDNDVTIPVETGVAATVRLHFSGKDILDSKTNGPYRISLLVWHTFDPSQSIYVASADANTCTTKTYDYTEFGGTNHTDGLAPTSVAQVMPAANAGGWNNTNVVVSISADDTASGTGVDSIFYRMSGAQTAVLTAVLGTSANVPVTSEGETAIRYQADDYAGNLELPQTITIQLDETPPTIAVASVTSAPHPSGSNSADVDVTVHFTCSDALSGIAFCDPDVIVSTADGSQVIEGNAQDNAGNIAATLVGINFTATPQCQPNPCQNSGVCTAGLGFYSCSCVAGAIGTHCETQLDYCSPNPCQSGGSCSNGVSSFTCACPVGFSGRTCANSTGVCTPGEQRSCYDGPQGSQGVGVCAAGIEECINGSWGVCTGEVLPSEENCTDGLDNDCDGLTDGNDLADCGSKAVSHHGCSSQAPEANSSVAVLLLLVACGLLRLRARN